LAWTASGISLVKGENTITFTAVDAGDGNSTGSEVVSLVPPQTPAPGTGTLPIAISISTPSSSMVAVHAGTVSLAGTATGGAGIAKVTWQASTGSTGTAIGTSHWTASSVTLLTGTNTIVVRAYDTNGLNAWTAVVVVRN